ncbi:neuraminidase-like domain-containing protein [Pseudomonas putida]|uniref:Tc toxin subunit A-related protein n=1 Tax=Pseudomonas putida TaxID=303 RepID=UPI0029C013B1|nr:neuraminidase-like domain-containing protein [Pseudomonas putida]
MMQNYPETFQSLIDKLGADSLACVGELSVEELHEQLGDEVDINDARQVHDEVRRACDRARLDEKNAIIRHSPLVPESLQPVDDEPVEATARNITLDENWQKERARRHCAPGDVASMFSPAAYLTELYRQAKVLYPEQNPWHIDKRRPDLKQLLLGQENLDTPISALSLSNEILLSRARTAMAMPNTPALSDDQLLKALSTDAGTSGTPYHHHHDRLRQVFVQRDADLSQLLAAPGFARHLDDASLACLRYDLPPTLRRLLTDEINETNAEQKFAEYFPGMTPESMMAPARLRSWFGLPDAELQGFMEALDNAQYKGRALTTRVGNEVVQLTLSAPSPYINYVRLFPLSDNAWQLSFNLKVSRVARFNVTGAFSLAMRASDFGIAELLANTEYRQRFEWQDVPTAFTVSTHWTKSPAGGSGGHTHAFRVTCKRFSVAAYLLSLNKIVRLHKATGLAPRALQDIIDSVDPSRITNQTLAVIFRTAHSVKRYGIDHQEALLMARGLISQASGAGEKSQFDRLFNDPSLVEGGLSINNVRLRLHPDRASEHADIKATLKRACRTDDEGLYELGRLMSGLSLADIGINVSLSHLSAMYTLSLWARHHGLTPCELRQLLQILGAPHPMHSLDNSVWQQLLTDVRSTTDWLRERGWTVHDLQLMTRSVGAIPVSTEIGNLLNELKTTVSAAQLPNPVAKQALLGVLSPLIASTFNLSSDALAQALLNWADRAKPGGLTLQQACERLRMASPSAPHQRALVDFAYALAQMALIAHACAVTGDTLQLLVEKPQLLSPTAGASGSVGLARDVQAIMALGNFSDWLRKLPDQPGAGGALLGALKEGKGVSLVQLSMTTGIAHAALAQAAAHAHGRNDLKEMTSVHNWHEIEVLVQWTTLAEIYGVMPATLAALLTPEDDWAAWRQVADAFQAGLKPAQVKAAHAATEQPLSSALIGVLGARQNLTVEALNKHLLVDALNSEKVMSSRIAEAMAALQQFIHRTLSTPEDPGAVRHVALSRQFFLDWTRWNASYANWAAGQMLMYYPENYIDPTVRLGQTQAMDDMLQTLGQAQINDDTVGDAFQGYLCAFEEVANLETISCYHDSREADTGKTWFVGRSPTQPYQYWWRTVDEAKRAPEGVLPANAWSAWTKIELSPQVQGRLIRPVMFRGRLHLGWAERQEQVLTRDDKGQPKLREWSWSFKLAWLRYDGKWSVPIDYPLDIKPAAEDHLETLSLFLAAWPERDGLLVGIYDRRAASVSDASAFAGLHVFENFSSRKLATVAPYLGRVQHWLDTAVDTGTCAVFEGLGVPSAENRMPVAAGSRTPERFTRFDAQLNEVKVVNVSGEEGNIYSLSLRCQLAVNAKRPAIANKWMAALIQRYPALGAEANAIPALLRSGHGAFVVRKENGQDWGYLCISSERMQGHGLNHVLQVGDHTPSPAMVEFPQVSTVAGKAFVARYRIGVADYPLNKMNLVLNKAIGLPQVLRVTEALAYPGGLAQELIVPKEYLNPLGRIPAAQVACRIYQANGLRRSSVQANREYDLAPGPLQVQFNTTAPVGDINDWGGASEALHRIEFQFGNGNTRSYTVKVYKDADALKTAIIGMTDQGAQYLAHRGQMTRLNTLFARELTVKAVSGIGSILDYDTQQMPEPQLGVVVRLTLPLYKAAYHGAQRWAKVWLATSASARTLLWEGQLNTNAKVLADVMFEAGQVYGNQQTYHLETQYSAIHNRAQDGHSLMIDRHTLAIVRNADTAPVGDRKLSRDNVDSVQAFGRNATDRMDFTGANALYFWELFYFTPMLVMQRFLQEERFDLAEQWLKYVFNPAGYAKGGVGSQRMWNVRPLEEDSSWNDDPLKSLDPDAVAQNDPMHYKLNVFMRLLDICIGRGDVAYRKLERDTLSEASVWYQRALSLLGDAPWTPPATGWIEPMLGQAAAPGKSQFLPEVNRVMLGYWEGLRLRQYNLRHNLTLDGQPLSLPLYAAPADPKALLAAAVAAEAGGERGLPEITDVPALRFSVLLDGARSMAGQLIQFGSTLQGILERQDAEALAGLLASQGAELADSNVALFRQTLNELAADRVTLHSSLTAATASRDYYLKLYENNLSDRESLSLKLRTVSETAAAAESGVMAGASVVAAFPKIFGLANGGGKPEDILKAVAYGFGAQSKVAGLAASRLGQEAHFARRRADWKFQYESAEKQMATVQAQLDALAVRETSAQMHIAHLQTQSAHAQAQLALHQGKFTGKAMYSWLRARLASIFYTYYDLTVSRCLMAQKALQWEKGDTETYLRTGTWNSAWAGLLCGEGLMLSLAQMETAWVKWQKREMEVTRTVSLAKLFDGKLSTQGKAVALGDAVKALLAGRTVEVDAKLERCSLALAAGGVLSIQFGLKALNLAAGFETAASRRIRSIAVSLPALLGPYQDVHARLLTSARGLPAGCEQTSISHALQDNGQFSQLNGYPPLRPGNQLLPFEGLNIAKADDRNDQTQMTLNFAHAQGEQKALLERLSDIILHVQFTVR